MKLACGHDGLNTFPSGFIVSESYPFLGATPVYDPSCCEQPYRFLEVKCPCSKRNVTPEEACASPDFCCAVDTNAQVVNKVCLKRNHIYYAWFRAKWGLASAYDVNYYQNSSVSMATVLLQK